MRVQVMLEKLSSRSLRNVAVLLGVVLGVAIVSLVLSIQDRVQQVPQIAKNAARQQAALIARVQADHRSEATLRRAQRLAVALLLDNCRRNNVLRRSDNNAHYGDYIVFSFVKQRFSIPTKTETPAQKKITREFATKLKRAVDSAEWTPLTDCRRAVGKQGPSYTSPPPVKFTTRLPPASALDLRRH